MTRLFGLDVQSSQTHILLPQVALEAQLSLPDGAQAIILFAQGRGSARTNAIDTYLAAELQHSGFATLLLDLYTAAELREDLEDAHLRFNVRMLAERLTGVADFLVHNPATHHMTVGVIGASTGGAAALLAAASRPETIAAIACRSGRPDLAGGALRYVTAPTLLIVGENDRLVLALNESAADQLSCSHKLITVPNAGHEFREPGALEQLAGHTLQWFSGHLAPNRAA